MHVNVNEVVVTSSISNQKPALSPLFMRKSLALAKIVGAVVKGVLNVTDFVILESWLWQLTLPFSTCHHWPISERSPDPLSLLSTVESCQVNEKNIDIKRNKLIKEKE